MVLAGKSKGSNTVRGRLKMVEEMRMRARDQIEFSSVSFTSSLTSQDFLQVCEASVVQLARLLHTGFS